MTEKKDNPTLSALNIYPVKSCKGISLQSVEVGSKGPLMDRRWMIIDQENRFMTLRSTPQLCLIEAELLSGKLLLRAKRHPPLIVPFGKEGEKKPVVVWKDTTWAIDQGDEAAEWLKEVLQIDARLVFLPDETVRAVNPNYATKESDEVSFADGYPFLLISEASLGDLNLRLETPVSMNRFRPNLVISGCEPYEEDSWKKISIGSIVFDCVKLCSRCVAVNVDHITGEKSDEPLQTLASYRKFEKGIMFGQNCIHQNHGRLSLGNEVKILKQEK